MTVSNEKHNNIFYKSLVIRDDQGKLAIDDALSIAKSQGCKAFKGEHFIVIGICGPHRDYGWVAVYKFERKTIPMSVGSR